MSSPKKYFTFGLIIAFLLGWSTLLFVVGPEEMVRRIGVENGYIFLFLLATFGGLSSLTVSSLYASLVTFAAGGLDPWLLGIVTGSGVTIGDSFFYLLGYQGRAITSGKLQKIFQKISRWISKSPDWLVPVIVFAYAGLTPLPNDILTVSLGMAKVAWRKIILPLLLGNIILMTIMAYGTIYGIEFVRQLALVD